MNANGSRMQVGQQILGWLKISTGFCSLAEGAASVEKSVLIN